MLTPFTVPLVIGRAGGQSGCCEAALFVGLLSIDFLYLAFEGGILADAGMPWALDTPLRARGMVSDLSHWFMPEAFGAPRKSLFEPRVHHAHQYVAFSTVE